MATVNVRMPDEMKLNGDRVLQRKGISTSAVVRGLYSTLNSEQEVPPWIQLAKDSDEDLYEKRRRLVRQLVGIAPLPSEFTLDNVKKERLAWLINDEKHDEAVL